jgi:predicted tellurium resistance membrane protein TerC
MISMFRYLKVSLALVLALVGGKMLLAPWLKEILGGTYSLYLLGLVLLVLAGGVVASLFSRRPSADRHGAASAGGTDTPR